VTGAPSTSVDPTAPTSAASCGAATGRSIPDGHWTGHITLDSTGSGTATSGAVYSLGDGELDIDVHGGAVTGGKWALTASSDGEVSNQAATSHVTGTVTIKDGAPSGTKDAVILTGTAETRGEITTTMSGISRTTPLNGSRATTTAVTILEATCDSIRASFLPDWNAKAGGRATISGTFVWTAHKA
jgi:hypothetical protein